MAQGIAARGKGFVTQNPKGSGALVQNVIQRGKSLTVPTERIYHENSKEDGAIIKEMMRK